MPANKPLLRSTDPASGETVWTGQVADQADCRAAVERARAAFPGWARTPLEERIDIARRFAAIVRADAEALAILISRETGKLLWDSRGEVAAMIGKVDISIAMQAERAGERATATDFGRSVLRHRPHGIMAVLGPYNFPGHLPNGHIVPALLAGNCVVFKPSDETPAVGEWIAAAWHRAGLPREVLQLVQGGQATGAALVDCDIDGLLFTGSAGAGRHFQHLFAGRPSVILALELGGNNALVAWDGDPEAIATQVAQSAFVTTGQRCSCARRVIVPSGPCGDRIVDAVVGLAAQLPVGAWNDPAPAFMGPLVSSRAASAARLAVAELSALGATPLLGLGHVADRSDAFIPAAVYDATGTDVPDAEIFAPVVQIYRVPDFSAALKRANATIFGLSAGLLSNDAGLWDRFAIEARAGVINWNRPTTGASSAMPFGGIGASGNHRPSAAYAADYAAHPVASFEAPAMERLSIPGLAPNAGQPARPR